MLFKVHCLHLCLRRFSCACSISTEDKFVFPRQPIYPDRELRVDNIERFVTLETALGSTLILTLPIIPQVESVTNEEDIPII